MTTHNENGLWLRYAAALRNRDFVWIWLGSLNGQSAYWALIVARGILVLEMTGSSALVGITTFAAMIPRVVMPPIAGYVADRFDRKSVLATSYSLQLGHAIVLTALAWTNMLEVWHVVALATLNGSFRAFQMTATQSLIPNLVPREHWLNAIALNQVTIQGSRLFGPGIIAPALLLVGPSAAFLISCVLYTLGVTGIMMMRTKSSGGLEKGASIAASLLDAARYAWANPQIRTLFVLIALHCSMTMSFESMLPVFSRDILGNKAVGVSYLMMAVGGGALVTVIIISGFRGVSVRGKTLAVAGLMSGLSMCGLALSNNLYTATLWAALMGSSQAGFMTIASTMVQSVAPDEMRGRISGLNQINVGGTMAMVNLANGFAADALGAPVLLMVLGLGFVTVMCASPFCRTARGFYAGDIPMPAKR